MCAITSEHFNLGEEELTGELKKVEKTDYNGISYEVVNYTPSGPGISYITATTKDGKYSVNFAVVCEPVKADTLSLDTHSVELNEGENQTLQATLSPEPTLEKDADVVWESFDKSVATIDKNGVISAVSEGFAYIKAYTKADNTVMNYCIVKVNAVEKPETPETGSWYTCRFTDSW